MRFQQWLGEDDSDNAPPRRRVTRARSPGPQQARPLDERRKALLQNIKDAGEEWRDREGISEAAEACLRDGTRNGHHTILHWVLECAHHAISFDKDTSSVDAAMNLAGLSVKLDPELLLAVDEKTGETALHKALAHASEGELKDSELRGLERLAKRMYEGVPEESKETVSKALAATNRDGETCIHIAVVGGLSIASDLVRRSDTETLLKQRSPRERGDGTGNTALHDAVAYKRCVALESRCIEKQPCLGCLDVDEQAGRDRKRVLELVRCLLWRASAALTMTNSEDETPYQYHLSTRAAFDAGSQGNISKLPLGVAAPQDLRDLKSDLQVGTEPPKADHQQYGAGGAMEAPMLPTWCQKPVQSDKIATEVEGYLFEHAFTLGGFDKACKCFFGKGRGKGYKDPIFRPGHALWDGEVDYYRFLRLARIMSQVDLTVPLSPADGVPETGGEERQKQLRTLWEQDMASMRRVFAMLRDKGVTKILKLRVTDNASRPCSDEVITECIRGFDVRYLDWQKKDLSAATVLAAAPRVAELWLYASGSSAVLQGWAAIDGLCNLDQMTTLHIEVPWGIESYPQYIKNLTLLDRDLNQNVARSRERKFLQYAIGTKLHLMEYQKSSIGRYRRELNMIQEERAHTESDSEIQVREMDIGDLEEHVRYLKGKVKKNKIAIKSLRRKCEELDHDTVDRLHEQIQSAKALDSSPEQDGASVASGTAIDFKPTTYPGMSSESPPYFVLGRGAVVSDFRLELDFDKPPTKKPANSGIKLEASGMTEVPIPTHRWISTVKTFADKFLSPVGGASNLAEDFRVKVALIDDGVDANLEILQGVLSPRGWPVGEPESESSPFYKSSAGHGTAMAKLIREICPRVKLYVAKLGQWTDEARVNSLGEVSTAANAAQAVQWAIDQKVHIISMSWSLEKRSTNKEQIATLGKNIQDAARDENKIIMYCAAADQSLYKGNVEFYPAAADTAHIKTVGSAKENGEPSAMVNSEQVEYLFPGEGIELLGGRKGSSAATALASGLAALIIWCFEAHYGKGGSRRIADPKKMHAVLNGLKATKSKWVDATKLLQTSDTVQAVVKRCEKWIDVAGGEDICAD